MKLRRIGVALGVSALLFGAIACVSVEDEYATTTVAEDCDAEDQSKREDDCGYWQRGNEYRIGAQPGIDWAWVWFTWVIVGQRSVAPAGWVAPHNLKAPTKQVRVPRKYCALAMNLEVPGQKPRPPAGPAPKPPAGNAPKAPTGGGAKNAPPLAPKPPVYKPPAGKVKC